MYNQYFITTGQSSSEVAIFSHLSHFFAKRGLHFVINGVDKHWSNDAQIVYDDLYIGSPSSPNHFEYYKSSALPHYSII